MSRPCNLPEPWASLAEKLGGVQSLADELHSATRTVRQWAHHERTPRGPARALVLELFGRHGVHPPQLIAETPLKTVQLKGKTITGLKESQLEFWQVRANALREGAIMTDDPSLKTSLEHEVERSQAKADSLRS